MQSLQHHSTWSWMMINEATQVALVAMKEMVQTIILSIVVFKFLNVEPK